MVACKECSWPEVTGLRWYRWLDLCSRWRRQQYSHFDAACQRPKCKNHPSRHGSIALPMPEVPNMSVGAICFTSSGSNGGCWVVLVFPRSPPPSFFFFGKGAFFFLPYTTYARKKKVYATYTKKKFPSKKKRDLHQKKSYATYYKKKYNSDLRLFPQSSYAFLILIDVVFMCTYFCHYCSMLCALLSDS